MQPPGGDPVPLPMPRSVTSHRRLKISQGENIDTTETGECYQPRVLFYFIFQESLFNIYQPTPRIRSLIRSRSHLLITDAMAPHTVAQSGFCWYVQGVLSRLPGGRQGAEGSGLHHRRLPWPAALPATTPRPESREPGRGVCLLLSQFVLAFRSKCSKRGTLPRVGPICPGPSAKQSQQSFAGHRLSWPPC